VNAALNIWPWRSLGVDTRMQADFVEWFGLSSTEARILEALYLAKGWLTHKQLALISRPGGGSVGAVKNHIANIREALDRGGIEQMSGLEGTRWYGNRLTERGLTECDAALNSMHGLVGEFD